MVASSKCTSKGCLKSSRGEAGATGAAMLATCWLLSVQLEHLSARHYLPDVLTNDACFPSVATQDSRVCDSNHSSSAINQARPGRRDERGWRTAAGDKSNARLGDFDILVCCLLTNLHNQNRQESDSCGAFGFFASFCSDCLGLQPVRHIPAASGTCWPLCTVEPAYEQLENTSAAAGVRVWDPALLQRSHRLQCARTASSSVAVRCSTVSCVPDHPFLGHLWSWRQISPNRLYRIQGPPCS